MSESIKIKKSIRPVVTAVLAAAVCLGLGGCRGMKLENKTEIIDEYTEPQAMILVANERNRYENVETRE